MSAIPRIALVCCVVVLLALSACTEAPQPTRPQPTEKVPPTSEPVALRPTPAPAAPVADDWSRIKAAKSMLVASSLDNPPFDMYNAQFQPDGFDIALMSELGKRLGVQTKFKDYAFDGLLNALQLNKADAVISALAITEDRQQLADFTRNLLSRRRRHPGCAALADHRYQNEGRYGNPAGRSAAGYGLRIVDAEKPGGHQRNAERQPEALRAGSGRHQ